ncbi:hypothetical protein GQ457_02G012480 [Hibiscus cannabinus]
MERIETEGPWTHGEASSRALPLSITPKANLANQCPRNKNPGFPLKLFLHATGNFAAKFPYNQVRMDLHMKNLFDRFQEQFIKPLFKAFAALYRTEPWRRLCRGLLFDVRDEKDSDWSCTKQHFLCSQCIGGDGGYIGFYMFRCEIDAKKMTRSRETIRVPNVELLRFRNPTLEGLKFVNAFMRTMLWQAVYLLRWPSSALCCTLFEWQPWGIL